MVNNPLFFVESATSNNSRTPTGVAAVEDCGSIRFVNSGSINFTIQDNCGSAYISANANIIPPPPCPPCVAIPPLVLLDVVVGAGGTLEVTVSGVPGASVFWNVGAQRVFAGVIPANGILQFSIPALPPGTIIKLEMVTPTGTSISYITNV